MTLVYRLAFGMPAKTSIRSKKMQTSYPLRVQAIRSRGQNPRLYVSFPLALAAAIGLEPGEEVQWELLDRGELHLRASQRPGSLDQIQSPQVSGAPHHKGTICRLITKSAPLPNHQIALCINGRRPFSPRGPTLDRQYSRSNRESVGVTYRLGPCRRNARCIHETEHLRIMTGRLPRAATSRTPCHRVTRCSIMAYIPSGRHHLLPTRSKPCPV